MIAYVYRPKRRVGGKVEIQRTYRGRYRLHGEFSVTDVTLDTADKQVAQSKLMALIADKEREKAGLTVSASERQAVAKSTLAHLQDFLADLTTLGRARDYVAYVKNRVEKLIVDCGFQRLGDIAPDKFVAWRSQQKGLSPKTLNDYLSSLSGFLNWMVIQNRMTSNPVGKITKVDTRGRQKKRRAITPEELQRLLAVTTRERRLIYLTAIYTGLRVNELRQMVWADLHLDAPRPFIMARASTTKNRKEAPIPLHPELVLELRRHRPAACKDAAPVFSMPVHIDRTFKQDLLRAGISPLDALGRKLDFHALRKTFGTRMAQQGVAQRIAQELMRHQDPKLTAQNYTDEHLLPTFEAVAALKWEGKPPALYTHIDTQTSVPDGQEPSRTDIESDGDKPHRSPENTGQIHILTCAAPSGTDQKLVAGLGFEPAPDLQLSPAKSRVPEAATPSHTQLDTQSSDPPGPELTRLVAAWRKLPGHIQKTILTLVDAHEASTHVPFENAENRVA